MPHFRFDISRAIKKSSVTEHNTWLQTFIKLIHRNFCENIFKMHLCFTQRQLHLSLKVPTFLRGVKLGPTFCQQCCRFGYTENSESLFSKRLCKLSLDSCLACTRSSSKKNPFDTRLNFSFLSTFYMNITK